MKECIIQHNPYYKENLYIIVNIEKGTFEASDSFETIEKAIIEAVKRGYTKIEIKE